MNNEIELPAEVTALWKASQALRRRYRDTELSFTLDGKLVGDIGEAVAAKAFNLELLGKRKPGVDARAPNGKTVQIKATGSEKRGPAFSYNEQSAQHLIFLRIDFSGGVARVIYNGPEAPIRGPLGKNRRGTKTVPLSKVVEANKKVSPKRRLPLIA